MKKISVILVAALLISLLVGCAGTTVVYYSDCTCPEGSHVNTPVNTTPVVPADTSVKTGLYIGTKISDSKSAAEGAEGVASYDVTIVAVTVDQSGIITGCIIDSLPASVAFDANGNITTDLNVAPLTKNELGEAYGMKAVSARNGIGKEWNEQAAALANYAIGKTVDQLKNGALNESGKAKDADLATQASIYLGGYVSAIEAAVANAQFLGANAGDTLKMAVIPSISSSAAATAGKEGTAQLDMDVAVVTMNGDVFTSCYIDSLQAKISFNTSGEITTDLTAPVQTKNELGEAYGMKAVSAMYGIGKEWNEQAAAFASYVTGKTAADIAGISFTEGKPDDVDLASSVTIYIGGFQNLIQKAAQ